MNLPCKVIEDLLPMYFEGLCSEESAALVEQHLKGCPNCSCVLAQLHTEFEITDGNVDDMKPLAALQERWQKSKWSNFRKGISITLAAVLLAVTALSAVWFFSYGKMFFDMAKPMERTTEGDIPFTGANYKKEQDGYRFDLWNPTMFDNDGYARVEGGNGLGLFLYPKSSGEYEWKLYITDGEGRMWLVHLQKDLTPDFETDDTLLSAEKEKEKVQQLVAKEKQNISAILEAVKKVWDIDLLQFTGQ